jgi:hypothetical protein
MAASSSPVLTAAALGEALAEAQDKLQEATEAVLRFNSLAGRVKEDEEWLVTAQEFGLMSYFVNFAGDRFTEMGEYVDGTREVLDGSSLKGGVS